MSPFPCFVSMTLVFAPLTSVGISQLLTSFQSRKTFQICPSFQFLLHYPNMTPGRRIVKDDIKANSDLLHYWRLISELGLPRKDTQLMSHLRDFLRNIFFLSSKLTSHSNRQDHPYVNYNHAVWLQGGRVYNVAIFCSLITLRGRIFARLVVC